MRQTIQRSISLLAIVLVTTGVGLGAPKTGRAKSEITVYGRVLKVDKKERTLLISDHRSKKLYLVTIQEGAPLEVFSGICRTCTNPGFDSVYKNDIVRVRCLRTDQEHLARVDGGRQAMMLTAAR